MGVMEKSAGLFLIVVGVLIFLYALPSAISSLSTSPNSTLENLTSDQKQIVGLNTYVLLFIPFLILIVGGTMLWRG